MINVDTHPEPESEQKTPKVTNDSRRIEKLLKQRDRAHEWRVQVWAQQELRLRRINAELSAMGHKPPDPWEPDFANDEMLRHYSEMSITPK